MRPFTEVIIKHTSTTYRTRKAIKFVYHPADLRDKLKVTTPIDDMPRELSRFDYPTVLSDATILVNYEE